MNSSVKLGIMLILGVLAVGLVVNLVRGVLGLVVPIAIVGGIGLILYGLVNRKALSGGRSRYLP